MREQALDDRMIDEIYEGLDESTLSEWEQKFVASTKAWWVQKRKLSDKQKKRLGELWRKQHEPKP